MDSFFGIGIGELFVIAIIALIVLGPERLPGALRELSKWMRTIRGFTTELSSQFSEEMKALDDINPHKILRELSGDTVEDSAKKLAGTTATAGAAKPAAKAATTNTTKPATPKPAAAAKPTTTPKPATASKPTTKPKTAASSATTKPATPAADDKPAVAAPNDTAPHEENTILPPAAPTATEANGAPETDITAELSAVTAAGESDAEHRNIESTEIEHASVEHTGDARTRETATPAATNSLPAEPLPVATHPAVSVNGTAESQGEA
jgi:sec-independent protein translocase protein TatB